MYNLNSAMKERIHPQYHQATVTCACGTTFQVGSTQEELFVEVCSNCHPFYTGEEALVDTAGRVEKFRQRMEKKEAIQRNKEEAREAQTEGTKASDEESTPSEEEAA
jgi:large subunit ribosomal protein L31